jgi:CheY-like chemotaxis protein
MFGLQRCSMSYDRDSYDQRHAASAALAPRDSEAAERSDVQTIAGLAGVVRRLYGRPLHVLLVTDDDESAALFADAAEESVLDVGVQVLGGVDEAHDHITRALASKRRRGVPDVVVCSLAIEESHRLLVALRPETQADAFPVIVLSDDTRPALERRSFELGAAGHMKAPDRRYQRVALIHALPDFLPQFRASS